MDTYLLKLYWVGIVVYLRPCILASCVKSYASVFHGGVGSVLPANMMKIIEEWRNCSDALGFMPMDEHEDCMYMYLSSTQNNCSSCYFEKFVVILKVIDDEKGESMMMKMTTLMF